MLRKSVVLAVLIAMAGLAGLPAAALGADGTVRARILLQSVLVAGLRHHDAKSVWQDLQIGDRVDLVREAGNSHDGNAVRLDWNGVVLGYLPQSENRFVARQLDRGSSLEAKIVTIGKYRNHRRKLMIEIFTAIPGDHR